MKFIFIGRLSVEKGIRVLIDAWHSLSMKVGGGGGEHSLIIIGDGVEKDFVSSYPFDKDLPIYVKGALSHKEAMMELEKADVLIFPSVWYEQFAITPLEAMKLSKPVIVSSCARNSTIIQNKISGLIFENGNAESLANTMLMLINSPELVKRMGDNARKAFEESDCSPEKNIRALLNIYQKTISKKC